MRSDPILADTVSGLFRELTPVAGTHGSTTEILLTVPRTPDPRLERYSGDPAIPFRAATAQEIADYDAAALLSQVASATALIPPALTALIEWLGGQLGVPPTHITRDVIRRLRLRRIP